MVLSIQKEKGRDSEIQLPFSKSIYNRLLIMQALSSKAFQIKVEAKSDDAIYLKNALNSGESEKNLGMAGTAMRFLTAYTAMGNNTWVLTGEPRLCERPIEPLVQALREMGAEIYYLARPGFPPLEIQGKKLAGGKVSISGSISSQFITALLLIAPYLEKGLAIEIAGDLVSRPYVDMSIALMKQLSVRVECSDSKIEVLPGKYRYSEEFPLELDWSAAAFVYQYFACSRLDSLFLPDLKLDSVQGDRVCADLFEHLGVFSVQQPDGILLKRAEKGSKQSFDLLDCPDLIPAFALAASICLPEAIIQGTRTLKNKESNRVEALKVELAKVGIQVTEMDEDSMHLKRNSSAWPKQVRFDSHQDHRMAMCLSLLADFVPEVIVQDAEVVAKSFPKFYFEMARLGFKFLEIN